MRLASGYDLGSYTIKGHIATGGMGEVYKARHKDLGRWVAIKVIPESLLSNPKAVRRFRREARSASRLSHTHVCTLYDFCEVDELSFLVLEYLDGETLEQRLKTKMDPTTALEIGAEIAEGLDHAHSHGLIHRDLKPSNVMLTATGAKVLDFGLAKPLSSLAEVTALESEAGPLSETITGTGVMVGTLPYMAPEQVECGPLDERTDLFALGVILYEMLAGRRPFEADSRAELAEKIVRQRPASLQQLIPSLPASTGRLVERCLEKRPERRWQTACDLSSELRWLAEGTESDVLLLRHKPAWKMLGRWAPLVGVALLALIFLISGLLIYGLRDGNPAASLLAFDLRSPPGVEFTEGSRNVAAVSPSGQGIVFVGTESEGRTGLWSRSFAGLTAGRLPGTEGAASPFWSPNGSSVGFFSDGTLKTIQISGGPVDGLTSVSVEPRGGSWNENGVILFAPSPRSGLKQLSISDREVRSATALDRSKGEVGHLWPQFLPDNRTFLYFVSSSSDAVRGIYVGSLSSRRGRKLLSTSANGLYANGHILFVGDGSLLAQPFDPDSTTVFGTPHLLVENVASTYTSQAAFSASQSGTLAYSAGSSRDLTQLEWLDAAGRSIETIAQPNHYRHPSLSRNGRRIAVETHNGALSEIEIFDLSASRSRHLSSSLGRARYPVWSPDGQSLAFGLEVSGWWDIYLIDINSTEPPKVILRSQTDKMPSDWSPDGLTLLYSELTPRDDYDVLALPLTPGAEPTPLFDTIYQETNGRFSSSGEFVAYVSDEFGRSEVFVEPFPPSGLRCQISSKGGYDPFWVADDSSIYYLSPAGELMSVTLTNLEDCAVSAPEVLFKTTVETPGTARNHFAVSSQGNILFNLPDPGSRVISVLINWPLVLPDA